MRERHVRIWAGGVFMKCTSLPLRAPGKAGAIQPVASRVRASSASAPHLPDADRPASRNI